VLTSLVTLKQSDIKLYLKSSLKINLLHFHTLFHLPLPLILQSTEASQSGLAMPPQTRATGAKNKHPPPKTGPPKRAQPNPAPKRKVAQDDTEATSSGESDRSVTNTIQYRQKKTKKPATKKAKLPPPQTETEDDIINLQSESDDDEVVELTKEIHLNDVVSNGR
jgi:hypothetical protein